MLQIDHVYEFLYQSLFTDFDVYSLKGGVPEIVAPSINNINIFTSRWSNTEKIFFYDQEPLIEHVTNDYMDMFNFPNGLSDEDVVQMNNTNSFPYNFPTVSQEYLDYSVEHPEIRFKHMTIATSEISTVVDRYCEKYHASKLYYFFHGFAALDWYRGFYALNYDKPVIRPYKYDFISMNRIINDDRSYRIYWVSKLAELGLLSHGQVSFNVTDNLFDDWRDEVNDPNTKLSGHACQHAEYYLPEINKLVIDRAELPGSASADIPREIDALWNVVTETVFYYDKLHLTEKIFKPIVSKQPFMLLAAPGNLEYLRSYGFKTFEGIIDESYDKIVDNDQRIEAVAAQLQWYCSLSQEEKSRVIDRLAPIVEYNFHHFYGNFRHIIVQELLANTKSLFKEIGYAGDNIAYENIYRVLTA